MGGELIPGPDVSLVAVRSCSAAQRTLICLMALSLVLGWIPLIGGTDRRREERKRQKPRYLSPLPSVSGGVTDNGCVSPWSPSLHGQLLLGRPTIVLASSTWSWTLLLPWSPRPTCVGERDPAVVNHRAALPSHLAFHPSHQLQS